MIQPLSPAALPSIFTIVPFNWSELLTLKRTLTETKDYSAENGSVSLSQMLSQIHTKSALESKYCIADKREHMHTNILLDKMVSEKHLGALLIQ